MKKPSQASELVRFALEQESFELFRAGEDGYALIPVDVHRECWPIRSIVFRRWLARLHFENTGKTPGGQAVTDALAVLEGTALFDGEEHDVHLRVAEHEGAIYLDLADSEWRAVCITANSWTIVENPPVRFRRPRGMLPLPDPVLRINGAGLSDLRDFCNVLDVDWLLVQGWLAGCLRPRGPYAVLLVLGEQGSAKSTLIRVGRELVDPNAAPLRREPREGRDLIVAARNSLVVAFDNVSGLSQGLSDDLARLATGAGFGARQLFTDLDEVIVHVARPIALNGIEEFAVRGDLLDRSLILNLPVIQSYQAEDAFWHDFKDAQPEILGALLAGISSAVANQSQTITPNVRMADFARWVTAAETGLNIEPGAFVTAYRANRTGAVQIILEASPVSAPVQRIAVEGFEGTATELLARLNMLVDEETRKARSWPKAPHALAGRLRRIAPALRRVGVFVTFSRDGKSRTITIGTGARNGVTSVRECQEDDAMTVDDADDADLQPRASGDTAQVGA